MMIAQKNVIFLHLSELVVAQVEFLQPSPLVDGSTQIQLLDRVLTEHQLSEVARVPQTWARKGSNAVGSHVHRPQAG